MRRLILSGASGKMGEAIQRLAKQQEQISAIVPVGRNGVVAKVEADVWVDFSSPAATMQFLPTILERRLPLLVGTTGFSEQQLQILQAAANQIPLLISANTSLGMNLLFALVRNAAAALGDAYDVDIVEVHHRFKKDAPSGTALELGRQIEAARGLPSRPSQLDQSGERQRDGYPRYQSLRSGGVVGEHSVRFGALQEVLRFEHQALNRDLFAVGALKAALWLCGKPAGNYTMLDVLGVKFK